MNLIGHVKHKVNTSQNSEALLIVQLSVYFSVAVRQPTLLNSSEKHSANVRLFMCYDEVQMNKEETDKAIKSSASVSAQWVNLQVLLRLFQMMSCLIVLVDNFTNISVQNNLSLLLL